MKSNCSLPGLYEHPGVLAETGSTVRPGGFVLTDRAMQVCGLPPGAVVLDVGCGRGASVDRLRTAGRLACVGLDPNPSMLEHAPDLPVVRGTGEALPFAGSSLDGLLCECVLGATPDPGQLLKEFHRVLKPGGRLIITDLFARNPLQEDPPSLPMTCCFNGARALQTHVRTISAPGFAPCLVEDHSGLLRDLAAKIVWNHGSLTDFWTSLFPALDTDCILSRIRAIKPGLFLCIARKEIS